VNHEGHSKPSKTLTPNDPSYFSLKKQVAARLLIHPTKTIHKTFDRNPTPFEIDPSSNLIFHHPPS